MATFPTGIFTWSNRTDNVDDVMATDINSVTAEVIAIETELGASGANYVKQSLANAVGDIMVGTAADTWGVKSVGSNGKLLAASSSDTGGVAWIDADFSINIVFGNGMDAIVSTDLQPGGWLEVGVDCVIESARLKSDASGSFVVDIWKQNYAGLPAADTDSITSATPPTLSSTDKSQDTTLSGWTVAVSKGDWLYFNVDSSATVKLVTLSLGCRKTAVI
jgi:hypothetical protein